MPKIMHYQIALASDSKLYPLISLKSVLSAVMKAQESKKFKSCDDWIKSNPKEIDEAYWKVRGVYVYEREWMHEWV